VTVDTVQHGNNRAEGLLLGLGVLFAAATMTSVAVGQIALALMLMVALAGVVRGWWTLPRTGLELPMAVFVGWGLLTIPFSSDPSQSLVFTKRYFLMTALWVGALVARDERARAWLLGGLLTGGVANAVVSLATEVVGTTNYSHRIGLLQNSTITGAWIMALAAVVALAVALSAPSWRGRIVGWTSLPLLLAALVFTWTRSGWLGAAAGFVSVVLMLRPRWIPALGVILVITIVAGPDHVRDRFATIVDPTYSTNTQRLELWGIGMDLLRDHPLTGIGDRNLSEFAEVEAVDSRGVLRNVAVPHLHQNQLMMAVLWGVPGLMFGTWLLAALGWRLWTRLRELLRDRGRWPSWRLVWLAGALGVWVVLNVAGLVDWTFGDAEFSMAFFFVVGAALGREAEPHSA